MRTTPDRPVPVRSSTASQVARLVGLAALLSTTVLTGAPASAAAVQDTEDLGATRAAFVTSHRTATDVVVAPTQQRSTQSKALTGDTVSSSDSCSNDYVTDERTSVDIDIVSTLLQHCAGTPPYFFLDLQTYEPWSRDRLDALFVDLDTDVNGATGCLGDDFFVVGYVDPELGLIADVVQTPDCDDSTWDYRGEAFIAHRDGDDSLRLSWDAAQVSSPRAVRYRTLVEEPGGVGDGTARSTLRTDGTPPPPKDYPSPSARDVKDTCDRRVGTPFVDTLRTTHEYSVNCASAFRITSGKTAVTFEPDGTLTQGQTSTFLVNTLKAYFIPLPDGAPYCREDDVHVDSMERLMDAGIIPRPADGACGPGVTISRERMAQWTHDMLAFQGYLGAPEHTDWYSDDDAYVSTRDINEITSLGVATGKGDALFGPAESLTRGQMATFLVRSLDALRNQFAV